MNSVPRDGGPWAAVAEVNVNHLGGVAVTTHQAEGNAKLIAAAPELLDTLAALVNHLEAIGSIITREEEPFIEDAKAAIAKAEGR